MARLLQAVTPASTAAATTPAASDDTQTYMDLFLYGFVIPIGVIDIITQEV